jgi:hypothetical protein
MVSVSDFNRFVFIVGAPRCGTTTLAQFLKAHPAVSFPVVKEPHFFSQNDLRGLGTTSFGAGSSASICAAFLSRDRAGGPLPTPRSPISIRPSNWSRSFAFGRIRASSSLSAIL